MPFDVTKMFNDCRNKIARFAEFHHDETFYAFAIDASLLCLNSEERFTITLHKYRSGRFGKNYRTKKQIEELRQNTGDWNYQGFAELEEFLGFDFSLYSEHYDIAMDSEDGRAPDTAYAKAMSQLIDRLRNSNVFDCLNRTDNFSVSWVDHDY